MKASLLLCLTSVVLVLGAGCVSSSKSRIAENQAAFNAYPADVQEALRKGEVKVGFTPEQVKIALGAPDRVLTRTSTEGRSETWVYRDANPRFGLGFGVGIFGGGSSAGAGVGVGTGGAEFADEHMRVIFTAGRVSAVEQSAK
ncbi:MAG TPA: hypothetical protein VIM44_02605 [Rariglobus sp.]